MDMKKLALLSVALLVLTAHARGDVDKEETKKLQGTWVLESGEKDGQKLPDDVVKKGKITWKGQDVMVETPHQSKEPIKGTIITLDANKKPKEMSWKRSSGP